MLGQCERCGAALPPPSDPSAAFVICTYCQTANSIPDAMRRPRAAPNAAVSATPAKSNTGTLIALALAVPIVIAVVIGVTIWSAVSKNDSSSTAAAPPEDPQSLARVTAALSKLEAKGCDYVVTTPRSLSQNYSTTLDMKAGGNCVHVLASAPPNESLDIRIRTPSAKTVAAHASSGQVADLEHCPADSGSRTLDITVAPSGPFALAVVDCAPAREKHRDDPEKNGLSRVSRRLEALGKKGCREVLFAPRTVSDEQSFTATLVHGAGCAVVVAASGSDDNPLTAELRTPLGRVAGKPDPAAQVELGYCAATSGPHPLTIRPKTNDYYTVGAVNCPRLP